MPETTDLPPLALALGRVPTGLYVVTTSTPAGPLGFVGSLVMQMGLDPPVMAVAVGRERTHLEAIRASGGFALSILDAASSGLMGTFFRKHAEGEGPFDHVAHEASPGGRPVLAEALAWLDCTLTGEFDAGDHVVLFGRVTDGRCLRPGDPSIHLRKNGLGY